MVMSICLGKVKMIVFSLFRPMFHATINSIRINRILPFSIIPEIPFNEIGIESLKRFHRYILEIIISFN